MNIWEQNIKEWYEKSETSRLNYLDLALVSKPTTKELAHNISVIYDRVCLSSKVTLKEFRDITLQNQLLSSEVEKLKEFEAVQVIQLSPESRLPFRATDGAAGYDLTSIATYVIPPQERMLISTGIALEIPPGTYGRIAPRSGLALYNGINIGAGVIDPDYRGEINHYYDHSSEWIFHSTQGSISVIYDRV